VHADPLAVTSSASTSFPLADEGPQTSIPASTGVYNDTLNVLADPLPGVDSTGHIYAASGAPINNQGVPYPVQEVQGYGTVSFPGGDVTVTNPNPMRTQYTQELRNEYRKYWHDKYGWYPSPDEYEIHHIKPLSRGGTNDFDNMVPLRKGEEHNQFTRWWQSYP
jgi:hypothetical protein